MIFVTVGAQLPFDRLVSAIDSWAHVDGRTDVFAQVGRTERPPRYIAWKPFLSPAEYSRRMSMARLVVGHAGIGTILGAREAHVPLVVMPRSACHGEHRSDHQMATCRQLPLRPDLMVVHDTDELVEVLRHPPPGFGAIPADGASELVAYLRSVIRASETHMSVGRRIFVAPRH